MKFENLLFYLIVYRKWKNCTTARYNGIDRFENFIREVLPSHILHHWRRKLKMILDELLQCLSIQTKTRRFSMISKYLLNQLIVWEVYEMLRSPIVNIMGNIILVSVEVNREPIRDLGRLIFLFGIILNRQKRMKARKKSKCLPLRKVDVRARIVLLGLLIREWWTLLFD